MKQLFIDHQDDMTRTALVIDGKLREIFLDHNENGSIVGRIFLGIVRNILPSQFAFIDIGTKKNAFMNIEPHHCLRVGQPVLVQVYKDASGTKGAYVGQEININGRFIIVHAAYTSDQPDIGISHKISDKKERRRLRKMVRDALPEGYGAIVRTNAEGKEPPEIAWEIERLIKTHQTILDRAKHTRPPVLLHQVNPLLYDLLSDDLNEIHIAGPVSLLPGHESFNNRVFFHEGNDLFDRHGITRQVKRALQKRVNLPCGGFITIEQTEACVIIDVNTGHFAGKNNYRETILTTNLEAAECIAWQLALRNLSGMIIIDFIDMVEQEDKQALIRCLKESIKKDRIKTEIAGMTELGLVQLTRKKTRESLSRLLELECPHCGGTGRIFTTGINPPSSSHTR